MAKVTVKLKYDDDVKVFLNAEATEEGGELVVKRNGAVIGRFDRNKVEHFAASDA